MYISRILILSPSDHFLGVNYEAGMKKIHAVTETGEVIAGMEVFREVYKVGGLLCTEKGGYCEHLHRLFCTLVHACVYICTEHT